MISSVFNVAPRKIAASQLVIVSERRAASRTTQIRRSLSSAGFLLLFIVRVMVRPYPLSLISPIDSIPDLRISALICRELWFSLSIFGNSGDFGNLLPLPWYPTSSQVIPERRGLQPSCPIPDPRSSALIRGKILPSRLPIPDPCYPCLSVVSFGLSDHARSPDHPIFSIPPRYPSIRIPKHLAGIIPKASQAEADWPKTV
jgi:hypothetical protein